MAFDPAFLSAPRLIRDVNKRTYRYRTTDSAATILGAGYFAGCADGGVNDRDMVIADEIIVELVDSLSAPTVLIPLYTAVADIDGSLNVTVQVSATTGGSHTHAASEITSGTLVHERGGLEADVSAYNGFVKISGGATSAVTAATGWGEAPTGTLDRTSYSTFAGQAISATPTQSEVQNIDDHVNLLSEHLAALITDLQNKGYIGA